MGRKRKTEEQLQSDQPRRAQRSYVSEIAGNLRRKPDDFPCSPAGRKLGEYYAWGASSASIMQVVLISVACC